MENILVTGALGYIGSKLLPYLNERGYKTIGFDTGFFRDCTLWPSEDVNIHIKDMRSLEKRDLNHVNAVVHLADISNDPFGNLDPRKIFDPTRIYTLRIAKMCKEKGIKFIFASSCSVYGKGTTELLTEKSETHPQTPYSLNKLLIEKDITAIRDKNFNPICLRFATLFGPSPRMRFDLVLNMFVGMALANNHIILNSDGQAWRPNIYIEDVCKAFEAAIKFETESKQPLILNVGDSSQNFKILDLAKMVQAQFPETRITFMQKNEEIAEKDLELVKDRKVQDGVDTRNYKVSFEAIQRVFPGFKCDWTVQDGVMDLGEKLKERGLTEDLLKNINFYRLQKIEYLHKNSLIDDNLFWTETKNK
ncbi:MAG: NAD-dependent epimerase/dehydratase family protein [Candidatus Hodarchaeales archaeon]|jgi:nucleoside-diphosphate-sugar epimerase